MTVLQAVIYGIIQGVGEFLPISSSAHLIAAPWLFGWKDPGLAFDVGLHLGTLVAVVVFFWKDWWSLTRAGIKGTGTVEGRLFWFLVIATIPGAVIGKLLEDTAETTFRNPALIGIMMIVMGLVIYIVDRMGNKQLELQDVGLRRSILIGISQAAAIVPGVSRAGITMSTGVLLGLTRESAARFSFLLSTPIILGAGLLKIKDFWASSVDTLPFVIGVLTSAVVGLASIKFLLEYLKTKGFGIFVVYRLIFGSILIALYFLR